MRVGVGVGGVVVVEVEVYAVHVKTLIRCLRRAGVSCALCSPPLGIMRSESKYSLTVI